MTKKTEITDTVAVAGERICSIIERIERLEEEIKDLMEAKKEIFAEAKGEGLDVKVLKEILRSASRTRTSVMSRRRCSTCTCAPWMRRRPSRWPRRPEPQFQSGRCQTLPRLFTLDPSPSRSPPPRALA